MTRSVSSSHYVLQKLECGPAKKGRGAFSQALRGARIALKHTGKAKAALNKHPNIKQHFQISNQPRKLST